MKEEEESEGGAQAVSKNGGKVKEGKGGAKKPVIQAGKGGKGGKTKAKVKEGGKGSGKDSKAQAVKKKVKKGIIM